MITFSELVSLCFVISSCWCDAAYTDQRCHNTDDVADEHVPPVVSIVLDPGEPADASPRQSRRADDAWEQRADAEATDHAVRLVHCVVFTTTPLPDDSLKRVELGRDSRILASTHWCLGISTLSPTPSPRALYLSFFSPLSTLSPLTSRLSLSSAFSSLSLTPLHSLPVSLSVSHFLFSISLSPLSTLSPLTSRLPLSLAFCSLEISLSHHSLYLLLPLPLSRPSLSLSFSPLTVSISFALLTLSLSLPTTLSFSLQRMTWRLLREQMRIMYFLQLLQLLSWLRWKHAQKGTIAENRLSWFSQRSKCTQTSLSSLKSNNMGVEEKKNKLLRSAYIRMYRILSRSVHVERINRMHGEIYWRFGRTVELVEARLTRGKEVRPGHGHEPLQNFGDHERVEQGREEDSQRPSGFPQAVPPPGTLRRFDEELVENYLRKEISSFYVLRFLYILTSL